MKSDLSARDQVKAIQVELLDRDVVPGRARELLVKLTALLGNCSDDVRHAEAAYTKRLAQCLDAEHVANRARIRAEQSPEYAERQEARAIHELVVELIRSLKVILRSTEEEMRLTGR